MPLSGRARSGTAARRPIREGWSEEAFCLAVGERRLRPRALVLDAARGEQIAEGKAFVGRTVVTHDALDRYPVAGKPVDRAGGKGDGAFLALVGKQFRVGQPRGVIDRDMHIFPAGAALVALAGSIAGDAMAN